MASSVLAEESVRRAAGVAGHAIDAIVDAAIEAPAADTQGKRWSCRSNVGWGVRLTSALAGTGDVCSNTFGVSIGKVLEITGAESAGDGAALGILGGVVCSAVGDCADDCSGSGSVNVRRTGRFISSANIASRGATATNTYPGAITVPTLNGCGGLLSTAINAAPWPTLLAITPDKTNLSAALGPGPAGGKADAPKSRANVAVFAVSGIFGVDDASAVFNKPADMPTCVQNQPEMATAAHTSAVVVRQPNVLFNLNIGARSSHSKVLARKLFHDKLNGCAAAYRLRNKLQRGFTLIELMVVLVIIGVLAALIVPNVLDRADDARVMAARTDVNNLNQALKLYKLDNQRLPTTEQGLQALIVKPTTTPVPASWKAYLDKLPNDPWGRPYQYLFPGIKGEVDVMSLGADGQPGGEGRNADIGSWQ